MKLTLTTNDLFTVIKAENGSGLGAVRVNLPREPLEGQMVYISSSMTSNETVLIDTNETDSTEDNQRYIYPYTGGSLFPYRTQIELSPNASISFIYSGKKNEHGEWWIFSANNT